MHKKHNQSARGGKHANTSILDSNGYDSTVGYDNALSNDKADNGNESSKNETVYIFTDKIYKKKNEGRFCTKKTE